MIDYPNTVNNGQSPAPISQMTDREIAEETLFWLREAGETLSQLQSGGIGSMMSSMMGGMFGKKG